MERLIEEILIYSLVFIFCLTVVILYLRRQRKRSRTVEEKIEKAKLDGLYEPVSLHPVVNPNKCIQTGACIAACPEKEILGIRDGKATTIHASRCIGHGACFHACPTEAITLCIGTEKRGVDLPHIDKTFETNISGIYIAEELGGMGLIRNAVEQGHQAVENLIRASKKNRFGDYDLIIVGAGPAGISASLTAKKNQLNYLTLEQDTLGGTVFTFPRSKIVMTSPMDLPLYGKLKLRETSKTELLDLWKDVLRKNDITIRENTKVESVIPELGGFRVITQKGEAFTTWKVLLAIGRRGTPRKLGIPGESMEKVSYRLLEPQSFSDQRIMVVGGGDSAVESALLLCNHNDVILSYRGSTFSRLKPMNNMRITEAINAGKLTVRLETVPVEIKTDMVTLASTKKTGETESIKNDRVLIFAGGELPARFLEKIGITITKKFGEPLLKHG